MIWNNLKIKNVKLYDVFNFSFKSKKDISFSKVDNVRESMKKKNFFTIKMIKNYSRTFTSRKKNFFEIFL